MIILLEAIVIAGLIAASIIWATRPTHPRARAARLMLRRLALDEAQWRARWRADWRQN